MSDNNAELIRNAIGSLENTIKKLDKQNSNLQKTILLLTIATAVLTAIQIIGMFSN